MIRPKRDASHASNRLTRSARLPEGRHLLSTFNKPEPEISDDPFSSEDDELLGDSETIESIPQPPVVKKPEPDIDAPPESSEEEDQNEDGDKIEISDVPFSSNAHDDCSPGQRYRRNGANESSGPKTLARKSPEPNKDPFAEELIYSQGRPRKRTKRPAQPKIRAPKAYKYISTSQKTANEDFAKVKAASKKEESKSEEDENETKKDDQDILPENQFKVPPSMSAFGLKSQSSKFEFPRDFVFDSAPNSSTGTSSRDIQLSSFIDGDSSNSTPLSAVPDDLSESEPTVDDEPVCPWCKAEVDPELLAKFRALPVQRIREQQEFCDSHKDHTAASEYKKKGYPEIDWSSFTERVQMHFSDLQRLLEPETPSYYRNLLDTAQKHGKGVNITIENDDIERISCGYYGSRGGQKMLDAIMSRFGLSLRRLAKRDTLVAKTGGVGYAQSVLVPELTVRLVKEDMNVDDDAAREIMRDSIDLGLRVNSHDDTVAYDGDSDLSDDDGSELSEVDEVLELSD